MKMFGQIVLSFLQVFVLMSFGYMVSIKPELGTKLLLIGTALSFYTYRNIDS